MWGIEAKSAHREMDACNKGIFHPRPCSSIGQSKLKVAIGQITIAVKVLNQQFHRALPEMIYHISLPIGSSYCDVS